jgi:hypothetical protein
MERLITALRSLASSTRRGFRQFRDDILSDSELTEGKYKQWDIRFKMAAGIGVLVAAWWAVHSYNETAEREARKEFWGKQIALYFEATEATSEIATLPSGDPNRQKATDRFWSLYFGQLRVVEDDKKCWKCYGSFRHVPYATGRQRSSRPVLRER